MGLSIVDSARSIEEKKSFHESIVDVIQMATEGSIRVLAILIKSTKIPENQDKIIEAWGYKMIDLKYHPFMFGVVNSLLEQKNEALEKAHERIILQK